jgi:hypothetical protein
MKILKQVTLTKASRKADKSVSIQFVTDTEQTPEELMEMDRMISTRGILYYSDRGELTQAEIDELDNVDIELEGKTQSQRMRSVMYIYWQQLGESGEFKEFYKKYTEKIIQNIKDKLD